MTAATDVDVAAELARMGRQFDREPTRVLLVDPSVPDPLAETTVARRPRPGETVLFPIEREGRATYVVEAHGAWHLRVPDPPTVHPGDEVAVHVA